MPAIVSAMVSVAAAEDAPERQRHPSWRWPTVAVWYRIGMV